MKCHELSFCRGQFDILRCFIFFRVGVVTLILFLQIGVNKPKCEMYDTLSCAICNSVEPPPMTTSLVVDTTSNKTCCSSHFFSQASKKESHSWGLSPHRAAERDYCDIGDRTYFSTWIWWRTFFRDLGYWNRWVMQVWCIGFCLFSSCGHPQAMWDRQSVGSMFRYEIFLVQLQILWI